MKNDSLEGAALTLERLAPWLPRAVLSRLLMRAYEKERGCTGSRPTESTGTDPS